MVSQWCYPDLVPAVNHHSAWKTRSRPAHLRRQSKRLRARRRKHAVFLLPPVQLQPELLTRRRPPWWRRLVVQRVSDQPRSVQTLHHRSKDSPEKGPSQSPEGAVSLIDQLIRSECRTL